MLYKYYNYELKLLYSRSLNFANFVFQKISIENMLASDFFKFNHSKIIHYNVQEQDNV